MSCSGSLNQGEVNGENQPSQDPSSGYPLDIDNYPGLWGLDMMDGDQNGALKVASSGQGVRVYIMDSGILPEHPELEGRLLAGYDACKDGLTPSENLGYWPNPGSSNRQTHGTKSASMVAERLPGIAKNAQIISVRMIVCDGIQSERSSSCILRLPELDHRTRV